MSRRQLSTYTTHAIIWFGIAIMIMPIYIAFVASTHPVQDLLKAPIPMLPGHAFFANYYAVLVGGIDTTGGHTLGPLLLNSFIMAMCIAIGKISVSLLSAFAIVYCEFPLRRTVFWLIFMTLMLPVEVRILPTFEITANLHLLNTYAGLTLPLIASATATFLFRQFFMTIPKELAEAARLDGAGALRFMWDIVLPLSRTNIAALFIIMFIYGWNQYLWPLVVTTQNHMNTIVMGIQQMASVADQIPQWHYIMATALLAMLPPVIIVIAMQRLFVKGLVDTEK